MFNKSNSCPHVQTQLTRVFQNGSMYDTIENSVTTDLHFLTELLVFDHCDILSFQVFCLTNRNRAIFVSLLDEILS